MVNFNPTSNPFKTKPPEYGMYGMKPPGGENPMYGVNPEVNGVGGIKTASAEGTSFKGKAFEGFAIPETNSPQNSFMKTGALGEQAMFGQSGERLGAKLNVIG